jgi:hypothetical protein
MLRMTDKQIADLIAKTTTAHKDLMAAVLNDIPARQIHALVKAVIETALAEGLVVKS